ncbi:MAG TPA: UbiA family prenyltransferase [Actinophytocola sp.]|nr:UbiA family prenyltransferase [Actinophytocola sp.]
MRACHPLPSLAVTAIATALAVSAGHQPAGVAAVAAAILAGQLSVGWLNDLVDARRDARTNRADKPLATGEITRTGVAVAVGLAAPAAVGLSLLSGTEATVAHLAALCSAWAYDLGVKATVLSVLPYAVSFGLLPAFVTLGAPAGQWPPVWLVAAAAVLGSAAHFANALPDLDDDLRTGVRGLPHRVGRTAGVVVASTLVLATAVILAFGPPGPVSPAGAVALPLSAVILAVGWLRARRPGSRAAFNALLAVAVVDVGLLITTGVAVR